jgi:cell wall-associated NlpC family hydrolase
VKGSARGALTRLAVSAVTVAAVLGAFMLPGTAQAATSTDRGASVLAVAETRTGDWYSYGADGPGSFDCSGLVYWAAHQLGISMPRDTFTMLAQGVAEGILVPTWHPVAGDLAFYGTGHVEIVDRGHDVTFGALQTGTRVGPHHWSGWWHPTMYFQVR